ncbi:MAG: Lrp/AsnC ligand binding domain-containing protein [Candidatus Bathyarchaeota archaeon]|nr:MAG: Lrp/AsnC ligand binding domain-containing protein [Candidatus Bathyarchaeota archaeon]
MISAFTLARISPEKNAQVLAKIRALPIIEEVTLVYGEFDIILKTRTKDLQELNKFIYNVLRRIPHITVTTTMIIARAPETK